MDWDSLQQDHRAFRLSKDEVERRRKARTSRHRLGAGSAGGHSHGWSLSPAKEQQENVPPAAPPLTRRWRPSQGQRSTTPDSAFEEALKRFEAQQKRTKHVDEAVNEDEGKGSAVPTPEEGQTKADEAGTQGSPVAPVRAQERAERAESMAESAEGRAHRLEERVSQLESQLRACQQANAELQGLVEQDVGLVKREIEGVKERIERIEQRASDRDEDVSQREPVQGVKPSPEPREVGRDGEHSNGWFEYEQGIQRPSERGRSEVRDTQRSRTAALGAWIDEEEIPSLASLRLEEGQCAP